uniref:M6 family metalloprotease domain-containing protein n=1 Tax=Roseihalotalea indica TaxID=2867963 RepID=A0AA49JEA0_9BACT|nr:M6 family metalloprotease domain-containing protein [Tunicatimonas sp. TK19036]
MYRLTCISLLCVILSSGFTQAQQLLHVTPPAPYAITVTQPDGSQLQVIARGDANRNWMETTDGYTVLKTSRGAYEFADEVQGKLVSSGIKASDPTRRSFDEASQLNQIRKGLAPTVSKKLSRDVVQLDPLTNQQARLGAMGVMPAEGNVKVLAILIEYPDLAHKYPKETFNTFFNGPSSKPTFKSYYQQNSHNDFNPTVEVVGWYMAKNNHDYYGEENGKSRARELVDEAIAAAKEKGVDFSQYDNNNDGNVDGVIIIHAGQGAEEGSQNEYVWSHRWTISPKFLDGKFIKDYTIQPELRVRYNGLVRIGVFCHEFGHLLGLPDLYDTDETDDRHNGIGEWGLMGTGGWVGNEEYPAGMTAFSKEMLGWGKVEDITGKGGSYELKAANSEGQIYKIKTNNDNEYFLLENRQQSGTDEYLKGKGLAIWHINTDQTKKYPGSIHVNSQVNRKGVDLEEADGKHDLDSRINRGDDGDLFPGSAQRTSFSDASDPNSDLYDDKGKGILSDIDIENIKLSGSTISFDYNKVDTQGTTCSEAVAAKEGDNTLPKAAYWYTFTLPKDGKIVISNANAEIFLQCDQSTPVASSTSNNLSTTRLKKGATVKIKFGQDQPHSFPLTWELAVNSDKSNPVLDVQPIANKTYGDTDFSIEASSNSDGALTYSKVSGPIEINENKIKIISAGMAKVKVAASETDEFNAAVKELSFTIDKASHAISFDEIDNKTYGSGAFSLTASSNRSLPVTFKVLKGKVTLSGADVTIAGAGAVEIEASSPGDDKYKASSAIRSFTVAKAPQLITFSPIGSKQVGDEPFTLTASSDVDLPVSFKLVSGNATLEGKTVTLTGSGEVIVAAYNGGNENYLAEEEQQSFVVAEPNKLAQNITLGALPDTVFVNEQVELDISISSELNPDIEIIGLAIREGQTITFTQTGEVTVQVGHPGNDQYNPAATVFHTFVVVNEASIEIPLGTSEQTLAFENIEQQTFGVAPFPVAVQSTSGLPITYEVEGPAEVSGGMVTILGAGEVTIRAYQAGNEEYSPSDTVSLSFNVQKAPQTISLDVTPVNNTTFRLQGISDAGLPVSIQVAEGNASLEGNMLTVLGTGVVTILAVQAGDENYLAAEPVSRVVEVEVITAIGDEKNSPALVVYPNPSNGIFRVTMTDNGQEVPYEIYNLIGSRVSKGTLSGATPTIDLTEHTAGAYLLRVRMQTGNQQYRIIKQ